MNPDISRPILLAALTVAAGCAQPRHLQYDYARAYAQSMKVQSDLTRTSVAGGPSALTGTEAILIRENVSAEDASEKTGKPDATDE